MLGWLKHLRPVNKRDNEGGGRGDCYENNGHGLLFSIQSSTADPTSTIPSLLTLKGNKNTEIDTKTTTLFIHIPSSPASAAATCVIIYRTYYDVRLYCSLKWCWWRKMMMGTLIYPLMIVPELILSWLCKIESWISSSRLSLRVNCVFNWWPFSFLFGDTFQFCNIIRTCSAVHFLFKRK